MSFEKLIRIPVDRIGVIIGKSGRTKHQIEKKCHVDLNIDSRDYWFVWCGHGFSFL